MQWLICKDTSNCNRWGETPKGFKETKHIGVCGACGSLAFLVRSDPKESGYRDSAKTEMRMKNQ